MRCPGISVYAASCDKYQLVQNVQEGETDCGLVMLTGTIREMGFEGPRTGAVAHLLMMFIQAYAHATVTRRWPGQHSEFLSASQA